MTPVQEAILSLHRARIGRAQTTLYAAERDDRALDDLVANPHRVGEPQHLARNARRNAKKAMRLRHEAAGMVSDEEELLATVTSNARPDELLEFKERLARMTLSPTDETTLRLVEAGHSMREIAVALRCTEAQARVRIHRARARARAAWDASW